MRLVFAFVAGVIVGFIGAFGIAMYFLSQTVVG